MKGWGSMSLLFCKTAKIYFSIKPNSALPALDFTPHNINVSDAFFLKLLMACWGSFCTQRRRRNRSVEQY